VIERVALGQTRFATPGVAVDARGVVLGRHGALLFAALDGVVGWLRLYSDEGSLDDLVAELKILRVRTQLRSRAFILFIPAGSSYVLDKAARCAAEEVRPQADLFGTVEQKRNMAAALTARVLRQALERSGKAGN